MIHPVIETIKKCGFRGGPESDMQRDIAYALQAANCTFTAEYELSKSDRVDFFLDFGVAIECKVKGSLADVTRQLNRYAKHAQVDHLILVTTKMQHARVPDTLNGKDVYVIVLHQLP